VKKFKTQPSAKKLLLTVFWDAHRVYVTDLIIKCEEDGSVKHE
jgi:hypothetical protein